MTRLFSLIERMATKRGIAILAVLYVIVFGCILATLAHLSEVSGGQGILDFERGYTAQRVTEVLGSYGEGGMALYRRIQILDLFNPALYTLLAVAFTFLLWKNRGRKWLCLMPVPAGALDYAENATLFLLARSFPEVPHGLVAVSSALSLAKNAALAVGMLPLLIGVVLLLTTMKGRSQK